ncbi:hypothetical protein [Telmatospirillum sp.]|uniref:hypothetical protein n=1 Tax=Telmatospirillum sp. TaxID=2079197 RepID=UPI00285123E3|nr:hypothetical protein [Telmatospirillum sp.]MDR3437984.1 hypothetical protein [Telmatospirillum sp.]
MSSFLPAPYPVVKRRPDFFTGCQEPTLGDLICDPIFERLLASDGIRIGDVLDLIAETQIALTR